MNMPVMLGDRESRFSTLSRSRSTSSMFQTVDSSPRNKPKANLQGHPLSYIPRHLLSGETAQHSHSSRLRSHSSPSAPFRQAPGCQSERSEAVSSRITGTRPLTIGLPSAKRRLEINTKELTQPNLTASQDRSLPESPGFPNMLAAMNFPIPPTTSRPSTADACVGSMARYPLSIAAPPVVRLRSSSKRATSSNGVLTASLDELIMQRTPPPYRRSDPGETSHVSSRTEKLVINTTVTRSSRSATVGEAGRSLAMDSLRPRASSAASSTRASHDSRTVATNDNGRQTLRSNIKVASSLTQMSLSTNEPCDLPIGIAISSPRDLAPGVNKPLSASQGTTHQRPTHTVPTISLTLPSPYEEEDHNRRELTPKCFQNGSDYETVPNNWTSTTTSHDGTMFGSTMPPMPNADDSRDSPILGRFLGNSPIPPRLPSRTSSKTREYIPVPLESEEAQATPGGSMGKGPPTLMTAVSENNWTLSCIMTTEIAPTRKRLIIPMTTNDITITPIMVVANLNPQAGLTRSVPSLYTSVPYSRAPCNKLKIISQPRQKSVPIMVHKSVTTSHSEHAKLAIDKLNRHNLTGVPTPPTSPCRASPNRNSHRTETMQQIQFRAVGKPILQSEPAIYREPNQEVSDKQWRVESTRERLEKAKLARDEEISKLVEKMLGVAKSKDTNQREDFQGLQEENAEEQIEKRLQRLEQDGDACLRDVKSVLQNMSKTLNELRRENSNKRLTMNEFNVV
ncbi:hypothetical protein F4814DRAFT_413990 [Daldinia grandis]|nr:hypothetical protein F4814DRAFT_413990 [Daldinia grandis]